MKYLLIEDTICSMSIKQSKTAFLCTSKSFHKGEVFEHVGFNKNFPLVVEVCLPKSNKQTTYQILKSKLKTIDK